jgi:hypothetical protein
MSEDETTKKLAETYIEKRAKDAPPPPMQSLLGVVPPPENSGQADLQPGSPPDGGPSDS